MSAIPAIERTPEYEKFIADLRSFHDRKGTILQTEPILGGKKLDLLRIYKTVLEAGGYEQVTVNRGWKQVGDPFNFPATCTNSAYILKAVYTKYLLGWEEETYWKRPWNPPPELLANYQKASSPMPSISNNRVTRQTGTAFTQPPQRPAYQHQPQTHMGYQPTIFRDHEFRTRILLSLQSSLPNETDWAFNTLVKFSYASENFSLDFMPTLIDLLLTFTDTFFKEQIDNELDMFSSKAEQENYERVLQVFHIIRNFSFLEMNIRRLAMHERLFSLLIRSITTLEPGSHYGELSRHCLDILENIAPQVTLTNRDDPYFRTMIKLLFTNDRSFILGAIRALTRVAVTETNERILSYAEQNVVERMAQFLMIDDEELEAATLEYLYQYSSLRGSFSSQLLKCYPGNLIGLLTGFLSYKSVLAPPSSSAIGTLHGIPAAQLIKKAEISVPEPPSIPDLTNYAYLDEPYRCLGWLKDQLMNGTEEDKISLKEIFNEYQKLFGVEKPLGMKEFYTVLKIAFPQPPAVEEFFSTSPTPLETALQNVKYSPTLLMFFLKKNKIK
ncbi:MAG: hypothetical protein EXX96DRAFT_547084 [Benjaminiella poitrasii]|nr:MAG: hypothetical protein EXX96DRAFT_547084 [Benjaminiella poitrasii]